MARQSQHKGRGIEDVKWAGHEVEKQHKMELEIFELG